jgi:FixJ family two-component response regulator
LDRAIATDLGIGKDTVDRARKKSTARNQAVGKNSLPIKRIMTGGAA